MELKTVMCDLLSKEDLSCQEY